MTVAPNEGGPFEEHPLLDDRTGEVDLFEYMPERIRHQLGNIIDELIQTSRDSDEWYCKHCETFNGHANGCVVIQYIKLYIEACLDEDDLPDDHERIQAWRRR